MQDRRFSSLTSGVRVLYVDSTNGRAVDAPAALPHWHTAFVDEHAGANEPPKELIWPLLLDSEQFELLCDRLSTRTELRQRLTFGWMAQATMPEAIALAVAPLLGERAEEARLADPRRRPPKDEDSTAVVLLGDGTSGIERDDGSNDIAVASAL